MKTLVIIAGSYGTGKTKLAGRSAGPNLLGNIPADFFNQEDYFNSLQEYYSLPEEYTRAGRSSQIPEFMERSYERTHNNRYRLLVKGRDFGTELLLDKVEDLDLLAAARNHGYHISLYFIGVDNWKICARRLKNNPAHWHHKLSDKAIAACYHRSLSFLPGAIPYVDEGFVVNNSNFRNPKKVLTIKNGRIGLIDDAPPQWLIEPMSRCL